LVQYPKDSFMSSYINLSIKIGIIFILLFITSSYLPLFSEETQDIDKIIRQRNQEIQSLKTNRRDTLFLIEEFREREFRVLDVLKVLKKSIKTNEDKLNRITFRVLTFKKKIKLSSRRIWHLKVDVANDKLKIDKQLKALFYLKKVKNLTHFWGMNSFENYFRNQKLLKNFTEVDIVTLNRLNRNLVDLKEERKRLKEKKKKLEQLKLKETEQKKLLKFENLQQQTYLVHLRNDRSTRLKYLREIQVELERLNVLLDNLEILKVNQKKIKTFAGFRKMKNLLPLPVEGKLVHRFNQKQSAYYTLFKRGVLVETSENAEVQNILLGKVVWAGPFRGYQNLIIVDHGKGSLSVYGNLEDIFVSVGDVLEQGDYIGNVSYDDLEEKYLFYFETRFHKRAVNPIKWFQKPGWK